MTLDAMTGGARRDERGSPRAESSGEPAVDVALTLVRFARELRAAGLGVSSSQVEACLRAFEWLDPSSPPDVYHAAPATLLTRRDDLPIFDRLFSRSFLGAVAHQEDAAKEPERNRSPARRQHRKPDQCRKRDCRKNERPPARPYSASHEIVAKQRRRPLRMWPTRFARW